MTEPADKTVPQRITKLKTIFAESPAYFDLASRFQTLLENRKAEIDAGVTNEARGIALIGASGSGKTTIVKRLIKDLSRSDEGTIHREVLSFVVPSPATLKFVGQTGLQAIGYPLRRDKTSHIIWDMFRDHLRARQTLFLHLDEAQDLASHQTAKEMQSVVNTLKSLMQNPTWPVGLILTGMPALKQIINHDPQLARRMFPIEVPSLNTFHDDSRVQGTVLYYAEQCQLSACQSLQSREFSARLIHAADSEFGLLIEYIIAAIAHCLYAGDNILNLGHFASSFAVKAGCVDSLNPFLAAGFERIDCRKLLGGDDRNG